MKVSPVLPVLLACGSRRQLFCPEKHTQELLICFFRRPQTTHVCVCVCCGASFLYAGYGSTIKGGLCSLNAALRRSA